MKKILTFCLVLSSLYSFSQTTSVNISPSTGMFDSTFVVPASTTMSWNSTNHPGAGPYMNAEIYLCTNATLTYDYMIGTSNTATFYLDNNATLIFPATASGTIATIYMKNGSTIQMPITNTLYAQMKRETNALIAGLPISFMSDTVFTTINFNFNGWTNPCLPSALNQVPSETGNHFRADLQGKQLHCSNPFTQPISISFYSICGQHLLQQVLEPGEQTLQLNLPAGLIFYQATDGRQFQQAGKLLLP